MPLRVALKKHFFARSERVKSVDFHPTEPFLLSALYDGRIHVHDYLTHALLKEIDASPLPLRTAKFVVKRQWILCGGDDCALRVFNLHTLEKVKEIPNAHTDYIRHVSVHASKPLVLSSSDDMTIKLWDFERNWMRLASYEQHTYYVMQTQWHPRDPNLFASCSLDRTIKVWGLLQLQQQQGQGGGSSGSSAVVQQSQTAGAAAAQHGGVVVTAPHFTLTGHERGINCIEYSKSGERPYIVSGSDDCTVRVWDYQTKQCIQVLTGHTRNVCAVLFTTLTGHTLPLLFSAGEDTQLFVWHALTYKKETSVDLKVDRIWSLSLLDTSSAAAGAAATAAAGGTTAACGGGLGGLVLAVGSDSGTLVLKMGKEMLVASLHAGKAVVARGFEILQANLRLLEEQQWLDGERLPIAYKELGQCDLFPQSISHHPSGRFIAVCGDGEYVIYTAQALRNKKFGKCSDFVWAADGRYAIREESGRVRVFTHFEETFNFSPPYQADALYGGHLLALKAADDSFLCFYDWESCRLVRRIDVVGVQQVLWSSSGFFVALFTLDRIHILHHDKYAVMAAQAGQAREEEAGIEIAFELADQIPEAAGSGIWASECLVYSTGQSGRIKCWCAGHVEVLLYGAAAAGSSRAAATGSILGYVPEQGKVYMIDRDLALSAFSLNASFLDYKVAIARKDFEAAAALLPRVPEDLHDRLARFLLSQGMKEEALRLAKDEQLRFEIALSLGHLQQCAEITRMSSKTAADPAAAAMRWKLVGDVALEAGQFALAASCFKACGDLHSLLLLYSASGDEKQLLAVAAAAANAQNYNVAFLAYALTHRVDNCVDVLCAAGRYPEAAFFARSYAPSRMSSCVQLWKKHLSASAAAARPAALPSAAAAVRQQRQNTVPFITTLLHQERSDRKGMAAAGQKEMRGPADPATAPEKFADLREALQAEKILRERYARIVPAAAYEKLRDLINLDIIADINQRGVEQVREELLSHTLEDLLTDEQQQQQQQQQQELLLLSNGGDSSIQRQTPTEDLAAAMEQQQQQKRQDAELNGVESSLLQPNTDEDNCPSSAGALHHRLLAERQQQQLLQQQRGIGMSEGRSSSSSASANCGSAHVTFVAGGGAFEEAVAGAAAAGGGGGSSREGAPEGSGRGGGGEGGQGAAGGKLLQAEVQQVGLSAGILRQHQLLQEQGGAPPGQGGGRALLSSSCRSIFSSSDGAGSTYTERGSYTAERAGVGWLSAGAAAAAEEEAAAARETGSAGGGAVAAGGVDTAFRHEDEGRGRGGMGGAAVVRGGLAAAAATPTAAAGGRQAAADSPEEAAAYALVGDAARRGGVGGGVGEVTVVHTAETVLLLNNSRQEEVPGGHGLGDASPLAVAAASAAALEAAAAAAVPLAGGGALVRSPCSEEAALSTGAAAATPPSATAAASRSLLLQRLATAEAAAPRAAGTPLSSPVGEAAAAGGVSPSAAAEVSPAAAAAGRGVTAGILSSSTFLAEDRRLLAQQAADAGGLEQQQQLLQQQQEQQQVGADEEMHGFASPIGRVAAQVGAAENSCRFPISQSEEGSAAACGAWPQQQQPRATAAAPAAVSLADSFAAYTPAFGLQQQLLLQQQAEESMRGKRETGAEEENDVVDRTAWGGDAAPVAGSPAKAAAAATDLQHQLGGGRVGEADLDDEAFVELD